MGVRFSVGLSLIASLCGGVEIAIAAESDLENSITPACDQEASAPAPSPTAESQLEWSVTYASRYSFQGLDYSEGRPVLQPEVVYRLGGFGIAVWWNLDQARRELNEVDVSLQREWTSKVFSAAGGYVNLHYPHRADWEPSHELFADIALEVPLRPSASVHWDVDAGNGRYWTIGLGKELARSIGSIDLSADLYVHDHYYGMTGFSALETSVSVTREWGGLCLAPSLGFLWTWANGDFRGELAVPAGWLAGLTLSSQ
jgi:hypothetical protein